jgi:hypothetical protein
VLLDQQSFAEKNLQEVFLLVSRRFPQPEQLWITVFTNLEQLPTPEEEDYLASSPEDHSLPLFSKVEKYPSAEYTRFKGKEVFQYSTGDGQPPKTVVMPAKNTPPNHNTKP